MITLGNNTGEPLVDNVFPFDLAQANSFATIWRRNSLVLSSQAASKADLDEIRQLIKQLESKPASRKKAKHEK